MRKHFPEGIPRTSLLQVADGASTCFRNLFNGLRDRPVKQGCSMHTDGKTKWSINVTASGEYLDLRHVSFEFCKSVRKHRTNLFAQIR